MEYFNSPNISQKYDEQPLHTEMAKRIGKALLKAYPFDDETTTVLDFACGTGLNSRILAPYANAILGVDISEEMVLKYNERVGNQGIPEDEMHAICLPEELLKDELHPEIYEKGKQSEFQTALGGRKFDVAICCMSYHHFPSISSITHLLASILNPGGFLFVADVESIPRPSTIDDPEYEPLFSNGVCEAGIVMHKYGFSKQDMRNVFAEAGLGDGFKYEIATQAIKHGKPVNIFLATGIKPLL
ncbi:S-adenosyl-L-methionine-dependent methyltransferase [Rhodocollybia butyracea]|uniref:S-adenosyl-L-methionine-dependent methyltransferase n=1 Tax=Rhodocollybia butyracea TaxID=206335 RepID=A0A9P5PDP4_9AGAR|nr:S-adenosyl-L-methionine-dependent methyltransferase [Rhodocollybia butyracea]